MGSSSSMVDSYYIHISLSTKHHHDKNAFTDTIEKMKEKGIYITVTDSSSTQKETCYNIKKANFVIYCNTQNYGACSTQALEYSYFSENNIVAYNVIVDPYENRLFSAQIQAYMNGSDAHEISSIEDIEKVIRQVIV